MKHGAVSGHLTGGAVDLTIADMCTNFYEASENITARGNRRLLVRTMESAGANYGYTEPPFKRRDVDFTA